MVNIEIDASEFKIIEKALSGMSKQIPFATSLAINKIAKAVKEDEKREILDVFDNPTRFTQNSILMRGSNKNNLSAEVWLKEMWQPLRRGHYLEPNIDGGRRPFKGLEKAVFMKGLMPGGLFLTPGPGVKLNKFGNVTNGTVNKILSGLGAQRDSAVNETAVSRARKSRKGHKGYFAISKQRGRLRPGIYERTGGRSVKPLFYMVRGVNYSKRFNFIGVAQRRIDKDFKRIVNESIQQAIRTAR